MEDTKRESVVEVKVVDFSEVEEDAKGEDVFRVLTFQDVMDDISAALSESDGENIARVHNDICSKPIEYKEDSIWWEKK